MACNRIVIPNVRSKSNPFQIRYGFQFAHEYSGYSNTIKQVIVGHNSTQLVSVDERNIRLWNKTEEQTRVVFPSCKLSYINFLKYIRTKQIYVAATSDLFLKVYDSTLDLVGTIKIGRRAIFHLEFNSATNELITAGVDGVTFWKWFEKKSEVWDKRNKVWKSVTDFSLQERFVLSDCPWAKHMHYENNRIYVCSELNAMVYDVNTGELVDKIVNAHQLALTRCIYYSPSYYYITSNVSGEIKLWSALKSTTKSCSYIHTFSSHCKSVTGLQIHPVQSTVGLLLSASLDGTLRVFNLEVLQEIYSLQLDTPCVGIDIMHWNSKDAPHVVVATRANLQIWQLNHLTKPFIVCRSPVAEMIAINESILAQSKDGSIRLTNCSSGETLNTFVPSSKVETVRGCVYSAYSQKLFTLHKNGLIVEHSSFLKEMKSVSWDHTIIPKDTILCIAITNSNIPFYRNNSKYEKDETSTVECIVGGGKNGSLYFWDANNNGSLQAHIARAHDYEVQMVKFQNTSTFPAIISVSNHGDIKIWNASDLRCRAKVSPHTHISCIATSSLMLFIGHSNGEYRIVDLACGKPVEGLKAENAHTDAITCACFNETFQVVITSSLDGSIKVWDSNMVLARELSFSHENNLTMALPNDKGDLYISEHDSITSISPSIYLPTSKKEYSFNRHYESDAIITINESKPVHTILAEPCAETSDSIHDGAVDPIEPIPPPLKILTSTRDLLSILPVMEVNPPTVLMTSDAVLPSPRSPRPRKVLLLAVDKSEDFLEIMPKKRNNRIQTKPRHENTNRTSSPRVINILFP